MLKRGRGGDSAQIARPIFEAYSKFARTDENASSPPAPRSSAQQVRVANIREGTTETLSLEDYVLGVTSAEASTEDEIEALEAQAITTRTFALKNLGRHASEGYDFCSLTHCELYKRIADDAAATPSLEIIRRAVAGTAGKVLRDENGRLVDAYFGAACGGVTANIQSLWGVPAPSYLRGVRDDYCLTGSQRNWTEEIPRARLAEALGTDERSDVGGVLKDVVVSKRDATGRAELVSLEGRHRRRLRGWEFKIIVGRALGWSVLKSSRFEVSRRGDTFLFRGSGFGHGLGLCQQGAHVMARRGMSSRQILDHYFPGTKVGLESVASAESQSNSETSRPCATGESTLRPPVHVTLPSRKSTVVMPGALESSSLAGTEREAPFERVSLISYSPASVKDGDPVVRRVLPVKPQRTMALGSLTLSSEHFRVGYPANLPRQEAEDVMRILESARVDVLRRLTSASLILPERSAHEVILHASTPDFTAATGQPWWAAGATRGRRSDIQPVGVLRRRGVLVSTLRQ
jgi:SpoIID/LytB domain protein